MLDLNAALEELKTVNYNEIQISTAWKWASRSCASYQYCLEKQGIDKLASWTLGAEYGAEAVEHAAMATEIEGLVEAIRDAIYPYEQKAYQAMVGASSETP